MKTKLKIIAAIVSVGILLLLITIFYILPGFHKPSSKMPLRIKVDMNCKVLASYLNQYYENLQGKIPENPTSDFFDYLTGLEKKTIFSLEPPVAPYKSEHDLGVYLFLPVNLESERPILIGYTTSVTTKKGQIYRGAFFLRDKEIVVGTIDDWVLRNIIGSKNFEKGKPNIYICRQRRRYFRNQSRENK
jgi:hypothetical protein